MCRSCHQAIDPLGVAFEHYGYYGAWRDTDGGLALDARGTIAGIDTAGGFDGALQLIDRLASSRDVRACHVRKWMETAYGRPRRRRGRMLAGRAAARVRELRRQHPRPLARSHPDRGVPLQACTMKPTAKLRLTRRSLIKGAGGIAIALPWLEAMTPGGRPGPPRRQTRPSVSWRSTPRAARCRRRWTPTGSETDFTLSPILAPLEPVKSRLLVLSGLHLKCGDQSVFSVEQLQGGMMGWLTGQVQPGSGNFVKGPSIDQVLAPGLSRGKPLPSLQMAVRWGTGRARGKLHPLNCCMFEGAAPFSPDSAASRSGRDLEDAVQRHRAPGDGARLGRVHPGRGRPALREARAAARRRRPPAAGGAPRTDPGARKARRATAGGPACAPPPLIDTSDYNPQSGLNSADDGSITDLATDAAIPKVGKLMMDMTVMALACDLTAVGFLQWADFEAKYTCPWLNLSQTHYFYENGGGYRPAELERIYTWYSSQHAYLLQQLAAVDMGGRSLLDETVVFFGTELQHPATHAKKNMPFLLAGGGLRTGRWVKAATDTPHNNLLVSLLNLFGDPRTTFGDPRCCTGPLPNLI
jgi:hypothetical protein